MRSTDFELRQSADGTWNLSGYASRTGVPYSVTDGRGTYTETIERGAFNSTIKTADVVLAVEHRPPFLARTPRTLQLAEDGRGLRVTAQLDDRDPDVQSLASKVRRGVLGEMSFAFRIAPSGESWSSDGTRRTVRAVDLDAGDVSVVRRGANRQTTVSVRGASVAFEVRSAAGISLVERRTPDDEDDHTGQALCINCAGRGRTSDGALCPDCAGLGWVAQDEDEDDDRAAKTPKYTAAEIEALGKQGRAFRNPDGHYSFPVNDREDLLRAVHAIGRSGLADKTPLRRFIIGRARDLNASRLIPASWAADGSVAGRSAVSLDELEAELYAVRYGPSPSRLTRATRGATERDKQEATWREARASRKRVEDEVRAFLTERWRAV